MPERDDSGFAPLPDEIKRTPKSAPAKPRASNALRNVITLGFIIGAIGLIVVYATVWNNPYSAFNPFPPDTPFPVVVSETPNATATRTPSAQTLTPSPSPSLLSDAGAINPSASASPIVENGTDATAEVTSEIAPPTMTFTPINLNELLPLGTPGTAVDPTVPTLSPTPGFAYSGRVVFITNPDGRGGCAWSSISGTVVDFSGEAVLGYGVRIVGDGIDTILATGSDRGSGAGGFEQQLGTQATIATYTVQLLNPAGIPASATITVVTRDDCTSNIAAVRFIGLTP